MNNLYNLPNNYFTAYQQSIEDERALEELRQSLPSQAELLADYERSKMGEPIPAWLEYAMVAVALIMAFSLASYVVDLELLCPLVLLLIYRGWRERTR